MKVMKIISITVDKRDFSVTTKKKRIMVESDIKGEIITDGGKVIREKHRIMKTKNTRNKIRSTCITDIWVEDRVVNKMQAQIMEIITPKF